MPTLPPDALHWLAGHHGIITRSTLHAHGVTSHAIRVLCESGALRHLGRGVYQLGGTPVTELSRMAAQCAMHPTGFVTGQAAGRLLGLRKMTTDRRITYTTAAGSHVRIDRGIVLIQSVAIEEDVDFTERPDGIRLATAARLATDLAASTSTRNLASIVEQMIQLRLCTERQLVDMARRRANARRSSGSRHLMRVLHGRVPGGPLESDHEVVLARALLAAGVPVVAQERLLDIPDGGPPVRVDLSVPHLRFGIEIDIYPEHSYNAGAADKRRDRRCHLIDWQVNRYGPLDFLDLKATVGEIVTLYRAREAALATRSHLGSVVSRGQVARDD